MRPLQFTTVLSSPITVNVNVHSSTTVIVKNEYSATLDICTMYCIVIRALDFKRLLNTFWINMKSSKVLCCHVIMNIQFNSGILLV